MAICILFFVSHSDPLIFIPTTYSILTTTAPCTHRRCMGDCSVMTKDDAPTQSITYFLSHEDSQASLFNDLRRLALDSLQQEHNTSSGSQSIVTFKLFDLSHYGALLDFKEPQAVAEGALDLTAIHRICAGRFRAGNETGTKTSLFDAIRSLHERETEALRTEGYLRLYGLPMTYISGEALSKEERSEVEKFFEWEIL